MKLKLLVEETTNTILYHPIATVTFYEGTPNPTYLRSRVREIVAANPWVSGRLIPAISGIQVEFKEFPTEEYFDVVEGENSGLSSNSSYSQIHKYVKQSVRKTDTGIRCLVYGKQLFQVCLIRLSKGFAIYFSLSHVIGDGHSFYTLYKMLDPKVKVYPLKCERNFEYGSKLSKIVGKVDAEFFNSFAVRAAAARNIVSSRPKVALYKLDKAKLSILKSERRGDQEFVSTNDLITSFYFQTIQTDYSHMVVNCRGRIEGIDPDLAGNYIYFSPFARQDKNDPSDIRKSVINLAKPHIRPLRQFSGASSVSLITSWTRLYHHLEFQDAEFKAHFPIVEQLPLADGHGIVFNLDKDKICLFIDASSEIISKFDQAIVTLGSKMCGEFELR